MNYAFRNGKILDGTKEMKIQQGLCILVENGIITDLIPDANAHSSWTNQYACSSCWKRKASEKAAR